jgi:polygalacturonase
VAHYRLFKLVLAPAVIVLAGVIGGLLFKQQEARAADTLVRYTDVPGTIPSSLFTVTATTYDGLNSYAITAEKVASTQSAYADVSYARFAFAGAVNVKIKASSGSIGDYSISPIHEGIQPIIDAADNSMTITLSNPGNARERPIRLIVHKNYSLADEKLFLLADPLEENAPQPGQSGVYDVTDYGADKTGATNARSAIQAAIQAVSDVGGGILYFPNGKYKTGGLLMKSNVTLYLESGALIQGTGVDSDFARVPGTNSAYALIGFPDVSHAGIMGRGVIDGAGASMTRSLRLVYTFNSDHIDIRDVYFRNSGKWTVHFAGSEDIVGRNYKIINDPLPSTDGTDPDNSVRVAIDGIFEYTHDDAIAVKASRYYGAVGATQDVTISNSVFWTMKSGIKIGSEILDNVSGVTFSNNDIVFSDRVMAIYANGTATISDIEFINNRSEKVSDEYKKMLVHFSTSYDNNEYGFGHIDGVRVTNHTAYSPSPALSEVKGYDSTHGIANVAFTDLVVNGAKVTEANKGGTFKLPFNSYTSNVTFASTTPVPLEVRVEAEDMTLAGYSVETQSSASGGKMIKASGAATATYASAAPAGTYDIVVTYYDENDGSSPMSVSLNGTVIDAWTANQNLGSASPNAATRVTRTILGVSLQPGDTILLQSEANGGEGGRIDCMDLIPR